VSQRLSAHLSGLQSDPMTLCASREASLEGVTGLSGQDCSSFFIEHTRGQRYWTHVQHGGLRQRGSYGRHSGRGVPSADRRTLVAGLTYQATHLRFPGMRTAITGNIQNPLIRAVVWFGQGAVDALRELLRSTTGTLANVFALVLLMFMLVVVAGLIFAKHS
jgi:hypothetical protein